MGTMRVITAEESYAEAIRIAEGLPPEERRWQDLCAEAADPGAGNWMAGQVKAYFPEFGGFKCMGASGRALTLPLLVESRWVEDGCGEGHSECRIDLRKVSEVAREWIYGREYLVLSDAVLDDLYHFLSRSAEPVEDGELLRKRVCDLVRIWDAGGAEEGWWALQAAHVKVGGTDWYDRFADESVLPVMVESYMSGVPADWILAE